MKTKAVTDTEVLLAKLEPHLPEDLHDEVYNFLEDLEGNLRSEEGKVDDLKDEVNDLENQLTQLEDKKPDLDELKEYADQLGPSDREELALELLEYSDRFVGEEGFYYLKYPTYMEPANTNLPQQLEDLINQLGVEEAITLLSQPSYAVQ